MDKTKNRPPRGDDVPKNVTTPKPQVGNSVNLTVDKEKVADKMAADAANASNPMKKAGPQPQSADSMTQMAQAISAMSQTLSQFMAQSTYQDDDDAILYDDEFDYDQVEAIDESTESELLGFANDGTPVTRPKRASESKENELPSKKQKILEKMKTEATSDEPKGPCINQLLADNVTNFMRNKPDETKLSKTMEEYLPPDNCPGLENIRVNESIWRKIPHDAKTQDLKMQKVHAALIKGTSALVKMVNLLLNDWDADSGTLAENSFQSIMENATNSLKILGSCNFELCMRRREFLRSAISPDFAHLCSASAPYTSKLFGEDVLKTIKELSDVNKVTNQVFHRPYGFAYRGRGRGRGRGTKTEAGKGGPFKTRGRGRGQRRPYRPNPAQQGDSSALTQQSA